VLDALFWHAGRQLSRSGSRELDSTVRFYVTPEASGEPDIYELRFRDGSCRVSRGAGTAKPGVTVAFDDSELVRLITGQSTPVQGVFNGRIMVRGDFARMATTLASVFVARPRG
jgi:alkyl sulfatase BDS1-like metallo-beta-lactamase superfamily hydrolase